MKGNGAVKTYTLVEAADILEIEHHRMREWVNRKYIKPSLPSRGRGSRNLLSGDDLYRIKLFEYLINRGLSRTEAKRALDESPNPNENPHLMVLTSDGGDTFSCGAQMEGGIDGNIKVTINLDYEDILFVNLKKVQEGVNKRILQSYQKEKT